MKLLTKLRKNPDTQEFMIEKQLLNEDSNVEEDLNDQINEFDEAKTNKMNKSENDKTLSPTSSDQELIEGIHDELNEIMDILPPAKTQLNEKGDNIDKFQSNTFNTDGFLLQLHLLCSQIY